MTPEDDMSMEKINPLAIKAKATKIKTRGGRGFQSTLSNVKASAMLDAVGAMGGTTATAMGMYGSPNSATVLAAAFSGVNQYNAVSGGGIPSYASMGMGGQSIGGGMPINAGAPVVPGTDNFSQMDMINTMNQNNLQLLELQAVMQSNMQGWNTKSNILSADHRARMAMIEKFTAR